MDKRPIKNIFLSLGMDGKKGEDIDKELHNMKIAMEEYCKENGVDSPKFIDNFACERPVDNNQKAWWLGEAIKKLGDCDTILVSEDFMKYNGCCVEYVYAIRYKLIILQTKYDTKKGKLIVSGISE